MAIGTIFSKMVLLQGTNYDGSSVPILKRNPDTIIAVMMCLALNGHSTTYDISEFFLKHSLTQIKGDLSYRAQSLERTFRRVIKDRPEKKKRKRDEDEKEIIYPGLVSENYVKYIKQVKRDRYFINQYFLSLKGSFFVLGIDFENRGNELEAIIRNLAKSHVFFAYVNSILNETDIKFCNEIFIKPISRVIKRGRIFQHDDLEFYLTNIAEEISYSVSSTIYKFRSSLFDNPDQEIVDKKHKQLKSLICNTFYQSKKDDDFVELMSRHYYRKQKDLDDFIQSCDSEDLEFALLYKVMRDVFFQYYQSWDLIMPSKSKNYPKNRNKLKPLKYPNKHIMTGRELYNYQKGF